MRPKRMTSSLVWRMTCALALFWTVGCKSDGARADESPEKVTPIASTAKAPAAKTAEVPAVKAPVAEKEKAPASDDKKKAPTFKVTATAPALSVGGKGTASVSIAALAGYKWNKEYPAKLIFETAPKTVKLGKMAFKQMAGDFKIGDKATQIPVSMMANSAGTETVKGALKFSICNETACIIEKAEVALAVNVQP